MPISQNKYVSITSSQGGEAAASRKDLILRVFTENELFPTGTVLEFTSAEAVSNFAGAASNEAKLASAYFGWVSKQTAKPKKISFMRYAKTAAKPYLRSTCDLAALAELKSVTNGSMTISMGGVNYEIKALSFADAVSYSDIAQAIQTEIVKNSDGGTLWTGAVVTFDAENSSLPDIFRPLSRCPLRSPFIPKKHLLAASSLFPRVFPIRFIPLVPSGLCLGDGSDRRWFPPYSARAWTPPWRRARCWAS